MVYATPRNVVESFLVGEKNYFLKNYRRYNGMLEEMVRRQNIDILYNFEVDVSNRKNMLTRPGLND